MKFQKNEEAVSPVIGVILMVAITVILAAVIAAFVFNLGGSQQKAPMATLKLELNQSDATIIDLRHQGGDMINWATTGITITGSTGNNAEPITGNLSAGGVYKNFANGTIGTELRVTLVDKPSNQMIADVKIRP